MNHSRNLRNLILFILQVVLVFSFTSCGHKGGGSPAGTPNTTPPTTTPPMTDLTGAWGTGMLSSGSENRWERGTLTIYADNSITQSTVYSNGTATSSSGSINTSENGTITMTGSDSIDVFLDSGGTVIHGATLNNSATGIYTALKKADSYSAGDLEGSWKANVLVSGPSSPFWARGAITVDSTGIITVSTFTALTVNIDGLAGHLTSGGSLTVSTAGLVTMATDTTLEGVMDFDKTVIIWTGTWSDGTTELAVLTKQAASYSEADLTGTWKFSSLSTGIASSLARGTMTISSGGFAVIEFENAGGTGANNSKLSISSDGTVTIDGFQDVAGAMDSGRTVMVFTETLALSGDSVMTIFTKQ